MLTSGYKKHGNDVKKQVRTAEVLIEAEVRFSCSGPSGQNQISPMFLHCCYIIERMEKENLF